MGYAHSEVKALRRIKTQTSICYKTHIKYFLLRKLFKKTFFLLVPAIHIGVIRIQNNYVIRHKHLVTL